jgi:hypothetical protein
VLVIKILWRPEFVALGTQQHKVNPMANQSE